MFKNLSAGALGFKASFFETIELAKIGNFQGLDIDVREIRETLRTKSTEEIKTQIKKRSIEVGGWPLPLNVKADEEIYKKDLKMLPELAQIGLDLGCLRAVTWITPSSDILTFKENFQFHVERLRPVAQILEEHKCLLGLEFVAPKTSRINHKHEFIHTIDGILELCGAIGTKNLGLLLDCWHWYTAHGTLDQIEQLKGSQVIYVHLNDAPPGIPIDEQVDNVRRLSGETGVIDVVGFLRTLNKIGYNGPVTPEPFEKKLKELTVQEAVKKAGEALDRVWKSAGI